MITVLIVDDEPMLRMALKSIVPWEKLGCEVIGEAANGKEAAEILDARRPDILITDIKMSGMNGVELIRYIREQGYETQILVLSGYDDFAFVREALVLGAVDYILKPSISEELLRKALKKMIGLIRKEKRDQRPDYKRERDQELLREFFQQEDGGSQALELARLQEPYRLICLRLCYDRNLKRSENEKEEILPNAVGEILHIFYGQTALCWRTSYREWSLLLPQKEYGEQRLRDMLSNIQLYTGLRAVAGVSSPGKSSQEARERMRESREAADYSFYDPEELQEWSPDRLCPVPGEFWKSAAPQKLLELIRAEEWQQLLEYRVPVLEEGGPLYDPQGVRRFTMEYLVFVQSHLAGKTEGGEQWFSTEEMERHLQRIDTFEELRDFTDQALRNFCIYVAKQRRGALSTSVEKAVQYMEAHYGESISLEDLAGEAGMNPAYFSRLFAKEKGMTCTEYLTALRINRAKELLGDRNLSVEQVAGMAGYVNSKYFFRVFKKATGMSPLKYRQKLWNFL